MEPLGQLQIVGGCGVLYQLVCAGRGGKVLHSVAQNLSLMEQEAAKDEVTASGPSPGSAVLGQTDGMRSSLGFPWQRSTSVSWLPNRALTLVPLLPSCLAEPLSGADCAQWKEEVWPSPAGP